MSLIRLTEAGDTAGVLRELGALTLAQRAGHAEALAARGEAVAADRDGHTPAQQAAQRAAELGCQVNPGAAAEWLVRNPPRHPVRDPDPSYDECLSYDQATEVLSLYPPAWRAELVAQLAADPTPARDHYRWFPLAERIIRDTGGPVPATDRFVNAWLDNRSGWARADPAGGHAAGAAAQGRPRPGAPPARRDPAGGAAGCDCLQLFRGELAAGSAYRPVRRRHGRPRRAATPSFHRRDRRAWERNAGL